MLVVVLAPVSVFVANGVDVDRAAAQADDPHGGGNLMGDS